jgi:hypothetical protein
MKIDSKLLELGFNESLINFYHSRTRNRKYSIVDIYKYPYDKKIISNGIVIAIVKLNSGRVVRYELNLAKIRQKRINLLMNK